MDKNSEEYKISQQIMDAIGGNGSIDAAIAKAANHVRSYSQSDASYILADPDWAETARRAQEMLQKTYINNRKNAPTRVVSAPNKVTKGQTAEATLYILEDPEKYGLTTEQVAEAAWFIAGTPDSMAVTKEDEANIREKIKKQKQEKALKDAKDALNKNQNIDSVSSRFGRARKKAQKESVVSDSELAAAILAEKKARTVNYLQEKLKDKNWANSTSNSIGSLYEIEHGLNVLHAGVNKGSLTPEQKEKLTQFVTNKIPEVGAVIKAGQGAQFFADPTGYLSSKVGSKVASQVTAKLTAIAAGKLAGTALGAALNTVAPVIGQIVGQIVGRFAGKYIAATINRSKKFIAGVGMIIVAGLIQGLIMVGGAVAGTTVILVPIVAFMLLVINNSGYVVPPGSQIPGTVINNNGQGSLVTENPYLSITKTANPPGPFQNTFPQSVEYTITISPKQSYTLSSISLVYNCTAIGSQGTVINCPPKPSISAAPTQITAGTPLVIKYTQTYGPTYSNSVVMDSFTIKASVEGTSTEASATAAVMFGKPPTKCFVFATSWDNLSEQASAIVAISQMSALSPAYMSRLCPAGKTITLERSHVPQSYGGFTNGNIITLYDPAFSFGQRSLFYTLTHESGHTFAFFNSLIFTDFYAIVPPPGGYVCSYLYGTGTEQNIRGENFAESIAVRYRELIGFPPFDCINNLGGSFSSAYPTYYNFMNTRVFK